MSPELERHYRTLEVAPGASPEDIRRAYLNLVQVWHPDRFMGRPQLQALAEAKLRELNAAYEALQKLGFETEGAPPPEKPPPPPPEPPAAAPAPPPAPEAAPPPAAREYRARRWGGLARFRPPEPVTRWLTRAWVLTAGSAVLFLAMLVGAREFYGILGGPVQATESVLQDAARLAARRPAGSVSVLGGWTGPAPDWGSFERLSRLWASAPRQVIHHVSPPAAGTEAPERQPVRSPQAAGQEEAYLALPNGTELIPPAGKRGAGSVRVVNATEHEAAVELASEAAPETALRLVYIRAGAEATIRGIGLGVYYLRFKLGEEWLPAARDFARYRAQGGPVGPLAFFQFQTSDGAQADRYEIVLKQ